MSVTISGSGYQTGIKPFAFCLGGTSSQSIGSSVYTKVLFTTTVFDSDSATSNSKFTAAVAGYYQFNGAVQGNSNVALFVSIFKNGSEMYRGNWPFGTTGRNADASGVVYLAIGDSVELYVYSGSGTDTLDTSTTTTYLSGILIRQV